VVGLLAFEGELPVIFVGLSPSGAHLTGQIIFFYESPKGEVREKVEGKWEGFHGGLKVFFHIAIISHLNHEVDVAVVHDVETTECYGVGVEVRGFFHELTIGGFR
jgi:hypothetical protein